MSPDTQELTGDALKERAAELDIEGRSQMSADELRDAVAAAESGDDASVDRLDVEDLDGLERGPGVASPEQNAELEHTQGGATTRDDSQDLGVPMIQGHPDEPVGPEDALGIGPKRGDYRERVLDDPHEVVPIHPETDDNGLVVNEDGGFDTPRTSVAVSQRQRTEDIGDAPAEKGGVDTDPRS